MEDGRRKVFFDATVPVSATTSISRAATGKQTLERRALHGRPGEAAIVIRGADELPALMGLALYVSLCRLALGIKTIEVLFESVLGGFAGIDSAAQRASFGSRIPKNLGPLHFVPVMARAMPERLLWTRPFQRNPSAVMVT